MYVQQVGASVRVRAEYVALERLADSHPLLKYVRVNNVSFEPPIFLDNVDQFVKRFPGLMHTDKLEAYANELQMARVVACRETVKKFYDALVAKDPKHELLSQISRPDLDNLSAESWKKTFRHVVNGSGDDLGAVLNYIVDLNNAL